MSRLDPSSLLSDATIECAWTATRSFAVALTLLAATCMLTGCSDDTDRVREIQAKRQARLQSESRQDHLDEAFRLLDQVVELNAEKANRQIVFHLNQWINENPIQTEADLPRDLIKSVSGLLNEKAINDRILKKQFREQDMPHLRDAFLFRQITNWVDTEKNDDPLLKDWMAEKAKEISDGEAEDLRTAARLFDWTIRNIAVEPLEIPSRAPAQPAFRYGLKLNGPGYRQQTFQTLWRGTGDGFQRSGVFLQLCRQAGVPAAMIGIQSDDGVVIPWCCGVLIGEDIYLFEALLGTFVPGPDQKGIATLQQARRDASILRRLGIPGVEPYEKYPFDKDDVQVCVALLNVIPESMSPRMKQLESGLTGTRRLFAYADVSEEAKQWDQAGGISGVQLWDMPLLAEHYAEIMNREAERSGAFLIWYRTPWMFLESGDDSAMGLSQGRWQHLTGNFSDDENADALGARTFYLATRTPEFEIQDLMINVELQKRYFRRELGTDAGQYAQQLRGVQAIMRMGKRTASYWLSLVQFDDGRIETANNWFEKRVLSESQASYWQPAARYNLARTAEQLGDFEKAIELYKTSGDPQEHGNRIRARLLAKYQK